MENVKIQDKNKRDNVKYMHVNGLDDVKVLSKYMDFSKVL